jgi:hypothetical protein
VSKISRCGLEYEAAGNLQDLGTFDPLRLTLRAQPRSYLQLVIGKR